MFSEVMRYILDLGPTVMLPIVIIIFSKILGMKAGDCFKAGLHIGIGFVGIGLVIGLMLDSIGPAAKAMAENFDLNLHVVDAIIEKIPGVNRIKFSADDIQRKFGPFGEPVTVGFVMGLIIGILAGYDVKGVLQLAVKTAAVMLLMPRVIKPIMDGLTPIAKQARSRLQAKFGGQEFLIGLDPALLLGHTAVVSASLIFIPLTILIAVCVPGNQVLPFGDLATIGFFVAMAVAVHRGNLFRTLISGVIIMSITLWIATQTIGLHTQLAANAGALKAGGMVASMDQGGSPITWLLIQVFSPQNIPGFIIIGAIYLTGIFMTWRRARGFIKQEKVVLAE
ncbi:hypothetical protein F0D91_20275 [Escherichia coli]|uniref:PTS transporter subunit IIC n=1 Tax=Escherichia coli TaxID=562 RepID=UPI000DA45200|nr:PTS transporter subunit IIC [Escherichia coli]EFD8894525.1 hypothetical protein [Escherichia coli]EFE8325341.1 hypothetical protein [Escherichia coli]EFJ9879993.1 hypothetical protein [Escherichia coli]EGB9086199.1 hypothetical protein [Escherichia coli]EJP7324658.1 hypothetical protein [Escherichia coli]